MKKLGKITALFLAALMLASCLTISAGAAVKEKFAVGSIVYPRYSATAPNMNEGVIDDTWGEKLIHITKNTSNAGLYANTFDYKDPKPEDTYVDMWMVFDDTNMYFAFFTNDPTPLGSRTGGDSVCLMMEVCNTELTYICEQDPESSYLHTYHTAGAVLSEDDYTPYDFGENEERQLTWLEKDGGFYIKYNVPFEFFDIKAKDLEEGFIMNFNFMRNILSVSDHFASGDGYLYWGKWFTKFANKGSFYVIDSDRAKTPNTMVIKKSNSKQLVTDKLMSDSAYNDFMGITETAPVVTTVEEEPEEDVIRESPSDWAVEEVGAAIADGLVPVPLRRNYKKGISRGELAEILSALLDKVYGADPTTADASFTDTTDANVLKAANLGIINGYKQADGTYLFKPENTLKRSEMSAIINRVAKLCGVTTTGFEAEVKFEDTASHWCNSELGWPVHMGIVKGTSATAFSPENTLTVEQTIMMVYRTFEALR